MLQVLRSLRDWHTCGCMMQHLAGRFGSYMMQQTLDGQTCSCVTASDWSRTSPELPALEGRELFTAGCDPLSAASTSAAASAPLRRPAKHKQICPDKHLQQQPSHCCTSVRTTFSHIWGNRCILAHLHHTCTGCPPLLESCCAPSETSIQGIWWSSTKASCNTALLQFPALWRAASRGPGCGFFFRLHASQRSWRGLQQQLLSMSHLWLLCGVPGRPPLLRCSAQCPAEMTSAPMPASPSLPALYSQKAFEILVFAAR